MSHSQQSSDSISRSGLQRIRRVVSVVAFFAQLWYAIPSTGRRWLIGAMAGLLSLGWLTAGGSPEAPKHGVQHWIWVVDLVLNIEWKVRALIFCGVVFAFAVIYAVHVVKTEAEKTRKDFHDALREGLGSVAKLYEALIERQDESDSRIHRLEREILPSTGSLPRMPALDLRDDEGPFPHDDQRTQNDVPTIKFPKRGAHAGT